MKIFLYFLLMKWSYHHIIMSFTFPVTPIITDSWVIITILNIQLIWKIFLKNIEFFQYLFVNKNSIFFTWACFYLVFIFNWIIIENNWKDLITRCSLMCSCDFHNHNELQTTNMLSCCITCFLNHVSIYW